MSISGPRIVLHEMWDPLKQRVSHASQKEFGQQPVKM
jgi:hypothetical protein